MLYNDSDCWTDSGVSTTLSRVNALQLVSWN